MGKGPEGPEDPERLRRAGETADAFYHGRVRVLQKRKGYRFSVDAPLLADFIRTRPGDAVLEIGTGSGIVALLLSVKPFARLVALEIQEGLADLARRNVELNGLGGRIEVVRADFREWRPGRTFDLIVSNPPYIRRASGFLSPSAERSAAKHELHGGIDDLMSKTAEWLEPGGRACFVYPERRRSDLARAADRQGFVVRRFRHVRPRAGAAPHLFLIELGFDAGGTARAEPEIEPPLTLFGPDGRHTAEAEAVFSGPAPS